MIEGKVYCVAHSFSAVLTLTYRYSYRLRCHDLVLDRFGILILGTVYYHLAIPNRIPNPDGADHSHFRPWIAGITTLVSWHVRVAPHSN
jgi:hypothetical protein